MNQNTRINHAYTIKHGNNCAQRKKRILKTYRIIVTQLNLPQIFLTWHLYKQAEKLKSPKMKEG